MAHYDYYEETVDRTSLRYVLYARRSSEDEDAQVRSIPDQIKQCQQFAEREGLHIVEIVEEKKSAKVPNKRDEFNRVVRGINDGTYDAILSWHPDRLSRNMLESGQIIDLLDNDIIKDLSFVTYRFTNNASGKMMLGMLFVMAKQYSEDLSEKVLRGNRGNLRDGKSSGTPRWGYDRDEITGYYQPNEFFDVVQKGWVMRAEGETIANVLKYWKTHDVHRLTKISRKNKSVRKVYPSQSGMTKMFRQTFYFGVLIQAGQEVDLRKPPFNERHTPMITEEVYNAVQALTYERSRVKPRASKRGKFYPLRGMVFCGVCNSSSPMRVGKSLSSNGTYSLRYRCDTKGCKRELKSVNARFIFDALYEKLDKMKFTKSEYEAYDKKLNELTDERIDEIRTEIKSLEGTKANKSRQSDDLARDMRKFEKKSTALKVATRDLEDIQDDIIDIDDALIKLRAKVENPSRIKMSKEEFLNLANMASDKMRAGEAVEKDILARKMLLNVTLDNKNAPSFIWKEPFATLVKSRRYSFGADERT